MDLIGLSILYGILGALIIFKYESRLHKNNIKIIDLKAEIDRRVEEKTNTELRFQNKLQQIYKSIEDEKQYDEGYKTKYDELMKEYLQVHRDYNYLIVKTGGKQ